MVWGLIRIPLVLVILFLCKDAITALPVFDGDAITLRVIDLLSLPVSRILLFLALGCMFGAVALASMRLAPMQGYAALMAATVVITVALFALTATPLRHALIPVILAATNFLPTQILEQRTSNRFMALAVGLTEGLIIRRHISWLANLAGAKDQAMRWLKLAGWCLAVAIVAASMAVLVKGGRLIPIEQSIRMPDTAAVLMHENINGLALDVEHRRLFATGHGLEHITAFAIDEAVPSIQQAEISSGGAQGIFRDVHNNELSVFNGDTREIQFFDARSLALNRSFHVPQLASGDPWIAFDPISDTIALVSEADIDDGVAFVLLDHVSGEVLDTRELDAGNVLKHPSKPWLYLSFFRRNPEILIYDMANREIVVRAPAPARVDRMALMQDTNELLVTSPVKSEILKLDADSLVLKGRMKGPFGVRTLAVDEARNLLFAGSFVTGQVTTYDVSTSEALSTVYLGPWLRSIQVDQASGTAYVSSNGALYRWNYDSGR